MTLPIEIKNASKWYGPVIALNDVTINVAPGVTGLLGPNGAGKSTLIRLVTGQAEPSLGVVSVFGEKIFGAPRVLARVGCLPDIEVFNDEWSGHVFVKTQAYLSGWSRRESDERATRLLAEVGLEEAMHRPIGSYSKGMRQRVMLAQALLNDPDVLILDEPLTGMDPVARKKTIDLVTRYGKSGRTVLVSSHILHEVEAMTDNVILIHHGRVLAEGKVHEIRSLLKGYPLHVTIEAAEPRRVAQSLLGAAELAGLRFEDQAVTIETRDPEALFRSLERLVLDEQADVRRVVTRDDSLEAVFDYLVK